jgi:hypothetical protein
LNGAVTATSVILQSNSVLTAPALVELDLMVSNTMMLDASSRVDATGKGYAAGTPFANQFGSGPGGGAITGGGGYGGLGGLASGTNGMSYGSFSNPTDFGSGGGEGYASDQGGNIYGIRGGNGGGVIRMRAQVIRVDGLVAADGVTGDDGSDAGAGGSVNLGCTIFSGAGTIRANGDGINGIGVGGGGGRVAITFDDMGPFAGQITAFGGRTQTNTCCIAQNGGAGTVYLKKNSDTYGMLIVDNGGTQTTGWSTPLISSNILRLNSLTVSGGAQFSFPGEVRVASGNPTVFQGLISSNYLQVGGLWINGQWVYGDLMELEIDNIDSKPQITFFTKPSNSYVIEISTNLSTWTPILTNSSTNGIFQMNESNVAPRKFFRSR